MRQVLAAALVFASFLFGAGQKRKQQQAAKVEIVHAEARRVENRIEIDGTVGNVGDTAIEGLVLRFEFLSSALKLITMRDGPISEKVLDVGAESTFSFALRDEPRAVKIRIRALDRHTDEPAIVAPGPYTIQ